MCLSSCITENHTLNNTRILRWSQGIFCLVSQGRSKETFTVPSLDNQSSRKQLICSKPITNILTHPLSSAQRQWRWWKPWLHWEMNKWRTLCRQVPLSIILLFCKLILRLLTRETVCTMTQWKELGQNFLLATCRLCEHKHTSSPLVILFIKQESFWDFPCRGSLGLCGSQCKAIVNSKGLGVRWPW